MVISKLINIYHIINVPSTVKSRLDWNHFTESYGPPSRSRNNWTCSKGSVGNQIATITQDSIKGPSKINKTSIYGWDIVYGMSINKVLQKKNM